MRPRLRDARYRTHRQERLDAIERLPQTPDARETTGVYCLRVKFIGTGRIVEHRYTTLLERALAVIGYSSWANVEEMWEE